jgi:UPF0042 nucleotide-binding protein
MVQKLGRIIVISGLSGSGKTTALDALEDQGFFCIDNLPVPLLPKFLALHQQTSQEFLKLAVVMDMRERHFIDHFAEVFSIIQAEHYDLDLIFLEASHEVLVRNFSATRRPHPLAQQGNLLMAIRKEEILMAPVKKAATLVVDTSDFTVHQLRDYIIQKFVKSRVGLAVEFISFGHRRGIPPEADFVIDVRFLNNPFYRDDLRDLDGRDERVARFVLSSDEGQRFLAGFCDFIAPLLPLYDTMGKSYLTVAVGCTGGQHRSVAIVEELARRFEGSPYPVTVRHRDIQV